MLAPHRRPMLTLPAPVTPLNPQLDLLLPAWGGGPLHVPPEAPSMAPQPLWATLSTTPQAQARQTSLQLLQEGWQDPPPAGEDDATPPRPAGPGLWGPIDPAP